MNSRKYMGLLTGAGLVLCGIGLLVLLLPKDPGQPDPEDITAYTLEDTIVAQDIIRSDADPEPETLTDLSPESMTDQDPLPAESEEIPMTELLPGQARNTDLMISQRTLYAEGFYCEPLSDPLKEYITGISYPVTDQPLAITYEDLCYVHILHYDFNGEVTDGELICNKDLSRDMLEIFYELYESRYPIEKVHLIEDYQGDDNLSMADNNTSCFNYRVVEGTTSLSNHATGCAIDINPLYNPYITFNKDGSTKVSPLNGADYEDRSKDFPYKIDKEDLCYKLFIKHGFAWGGVWRSSKDYQHFQKPLN